MDLNYFKQLILVHQLYKQTFCLALANQNLKIQITAQSRYVLLAYTTKIHWKHNYLQTVWECMHSQIHSPLFFSESLKKM